ILVDNCAVATALVFFFFSSRRRHTRLQGDWSSDVCSSDLGPDPSNTFNGVAIPNVAFVSLSLADVTAANSKDRGQTFSIGTSMEIGRASCRERVKIAVVGRAVKRRGEAKVVA